jgi:hypothetical protein
MATIEQLDDLYRFAKDLPDEELSQLSIDEVYDLWRTGTVLDEDVTAIQEALDAYDRGERGRPAEEFLAEVRTEREMGLRRCHLYTSPPLSPESPGFRLACDLRHPLKWCWNLPS